MHDLRRHDRCPAAAALLLLSIALHAPVLRAQAAPAAGALPAVEVTGAPQDSVGATMTASEGSVTRARILERPLSRPAEILEFVPGMIVSQHSGDGKANQYYLRGFNLDHGTDFATFVDGMPVNQPSHAHGQGYTDLNFLIPELVRGIDYRKGVYAAEDGDFGSVGSARIRLVDELPGGLGAITAGTNGYARAMAADSLRLARGSLLYALEAAHADGPWEVPQNLRRFNGVLRYSLGDGPTRQSLTLMGYGSGWRSTDQVPRRAIEQGLVGRFGSIDPTDRGEARRASLSWNLQRVLDDGELRASAYFIRSSLALFSNFTYFLERPDTGDQFAQTESRKVMGGSFSRLWEGRIGEHPATTSLGLQWRHDRLDPVGLYDAQDGERTDTVQQSRVRQTGLGVYAQNEVRWTPCISSVAGLRLDQFTFEAHSTIPDNSGRRAAGKVSPKLAAVFGPWSGAEFFLGAGRGFHSNDARGVNARIDPRTGEPVDAALPLVGTLGWEAGMRVSPLPGLRTSIALWSLRLDSELVFAGDAGATAPSGASRRQGIEIANRWMVHRRFTLEADLALSQARFDEDQGDAPNRGRQVPGAARAVASLAATFRPQGPWSGQLRIRHFGPRALIEDGSARSRASTLASLRAAWQMNRDLRVTFDVLNLFNRKVSDIDYYYVSRLPGEAPGGIADLHSHPAEPRAVRVTLSLAH
jgi:hypothetical protein